MKATGNETALVKACLALLRLRGILAWRCNTGCARYTDATGGKRLVRFGVPGMSDILCVLPGGRFLAVECKVGRNQLTSDQAVFLARVNAAGGLGVCVRSVDELEAVL